MYKGAKKIHKMLDLNETVCCVYLPLSELTWLWITDGCELKGGWVVELAGGTCRLGAVERCTLTVSTHSSKLLFHTITYSKYKLLLIPKLHSKVKLPIKLCIKKECIQLFFLAFFSGVLFYELWRKHIIFDPVRKSISYSVFRISLHLFIRTSRGKVLSCPGKGHTGYWTLEWGKEEWKDGVKKRRWKGSYPNFVFAGALYS